MPDGVNTYTNAGFERARVVPENIYAKALPHGFIYSDITSAQIIASFGQIINVRNYPLNDEETDFNYEQAVADFISNGTAWTLKFPSGQYVLHSEVFEKLTANRIAIIGDGVGTEITIPLGADTSTLFKIGEPRIGIDETLGTAIPFPSSIVYIGNFSVINLNTAATHLFQLDNVTDVYFRDIRAVGLSGFVKLGPTGRVIRCTYENITGTWFADRGINLIEGIRCITQRWASCHFTAVTSAPGLYQALRLRPEADTYLSTEVYPEDHELAGQRVRKYLTNCDGWYMENCDIWGSGEGINVVTEFDISRGHIFNVDIDRHVSDRSRESGILIKSDPGPVIVAEANSGLPETLPDTRQPSGRWISFRRPRIGTRTGIGFEIDWQGSGVLIGVTLTDPVIMSETGAAVRVTETDPANNRVRGFKLLGGTIGDAEEGEGGIDPNSGTLRESLIQMGVNNWSVIGTTITSANINGYTNFNHVFETVSDVDNFVVTGVTAGNEQISFFKHFSYSDESEFRIVANNVGKVNASSSGSTSEELTIDQIADRVDALTDYPAPLRNRYFHGNWYRGEEMGPSANGVAVTPDTIYFVPFSLYQDIRIRNLAVRVTTAAGASPTAVCQCAIYTDINDAPGRLMCNTLDIAVHATATISSTLAQGDVSLRKGRYYFATNSNTACAFYSQTAGGNMLMRKRGSASVSTALNSASPTALSLANPLASGWPTLPYKQTFGEPLTSVGAELAFRYAPSGFPFFQPPYDGAATGTLTFSGLGTDGDTITVGTRTYTLRTVLAAPNEVLIGASASETATNFDSAMRAGLGNGVTYSTGTTVHLDVDAVVAGAVVTLNAKVNGEAGNAIATTEIGTSASFVVPTLTGGFGPNELRIFFVTGQSFASALNAEIITKTAVNSLYAFMTNIANPMFWRRENDPISGSATPLLRAVEITDLVPLFEGESQYHSRDDFPFETQASATTAWIIGNRLVDLQDSGGNPRVRYLGIVSAGSGNGHEELVKGQPFFENVLTSVKKVYQLARERGWLASVCAGFLVHGENDSHGETAYAVYKDFLINLHANYNTEIKAIIPNQGDIPLLISQNSNLYEPEATETYEDIPLAMLEAADQVDGIHIIGARYHTYINQWDPHPKGMSSRLLGEEMGRALAALEWDGATEVPLIRMATAVWDGATTIDVTYTGDFVPPLVFDTTTIFDPDNEGILVPAKPVRKPKGFEFDEGLGEEPHDRAVFCTNAVILNPSTVRLTLNTTPDIATISGWEVWYAVSGVPGAQQHPTPNGVAYGGTVVRQWDGNAIRGAPRGNLRDSTTDMTVGLYEVLPGESKEKFPVSTTKTATYTVVLGDSGVRFIWAGLVAGTFNLTAAATLGAGFTFRIVNSGTTTLTIDPAGAETINGGATFDVLAGTAYEITCNGSVFATNNYKVRAADDQTTVKWTGGATTFDVNSAGVGFWFRIVNNGTGTVTLDPTGAETINGGATLGVTVGQTMEITSTGVGVWTAASFLASRPLYRWAPHQTIPVTAA